MSQTWSNAQARGIVRVGSKPAPVVVTQAGIGPPASAPNTGVGPE